MRFWAVVLACSLVLPAWALAGDRGTPPRAPRPEDVVAGAVAQILGVLGRHEAPASASAQVNRVAGGLFDVQGMARRALSLHWAACSLEQRAQFVELFSALLGSTFLRHVQERTADTLRYEGMVDGAFATVTERSARARESTRYRLSLSDGEWKVYDLVTDGFSFISTYRSDFGRLVDARRFAGLLQSLRAEPEPRGSAADGEEERWRLFLPALLEHLVRRY